PIGGRKLNFVESHQRIARLALVDPILAGATNHARRPHGKPRLLLKLAHQSCGLVLVRFDAAARQVVLVSRLLADLHDRDVGLAPRTDAVGAHSFQISQSRLGLANLQREAGHEPRYSARASAWRQELSP